MRKQPELTPLQKGMVFDRTMIGGAQGLVGGYGSGALAQGAANAIMRKMHMGDFERKYKEIPKDKEAFIQYLQEKAEREKDLAEKTKWLKLIPLVTTILGAVKGGIAANKAEKAAILADILKRRKK